LKSGRFRVYLLLIALLAAIVMAALHFAGGRTPLGIGILVAVEIAAILAALALSVREITDR
jgi:hypothetical protein